MPLIDERKPVAWVPCGDRELQSEETAPSWHMLTTSEAQVAFWINDCHLRVRPVFLGEPLP